MASERFREMFTPWLALNIRENDGVRKKQQANFEENPIVVLLRLHGAPRGPIMFSAQRPL